MVLDKKYGNPLITNDGVTIAKDVELEDAFEKKLLHEQEAEETLPDARGEAVEALTALGYSPADALRAVQKVEPGDDMDTEAILKAALKRMI